MKIEKNTKIGEIVEKAPEKVDILLSVGMHCLGCPASRGESIEDACAVHGTSADELVEKINAFLSEKEG